MFIFYVGNLLNSFLSSRSITSRFLVFSIQAVIPYTDRSSFISSFLIYFTSIFFSSLTELARNPSIVLNKSVENRYLRRKEKTFTLPPSNMMLAIVLFFSFVDALQQSEIYPSTPIFQSFYNEQVLNSVKCFFCIS